MFRMQRFRLRFDGPDFLRASATCPTLSVRPYSRDIRIDIPAHTLFAVDRPLPNRAMWNPDPRRESIVNAPPRQRPDRGQLVLDTEGSIVERGSNATARTRMTRAADT